MSSYDLTMSPEVFTLLATLVEERVGLRYSLDDLELFRGKVSLRAIELGFDSLLDYYYFLRYDAEGDEELGQLGEQLTVNESYLFREFAPLVQVVDHELVPRVRSGVRPRVWCAACANGEEAFTLAMLLADRQILDDVDLVASDVSRRCLERATSGTLARRAVRQVPRPDLLDRWVDAERTRVDARLVEHIDFRRVNLLDDAAVAGIGSCDVILCRNVMIYFSDETTRALVGRFVKLLRPGGTLWVGVSESLLRLGAQLECEERGGVFFYRRGDA